MATELGIGKNLILEMKKTRGIVYVQILSRSHKDAESKVDNTLWADLLGTFTDGICIFIKNQANGDLRTIW